MRQRLEAQFGDKKGQKAMTIDPFIPSVSRCRGKERALWLILCGPGTAAQVIQEMDLKIKPSAFFAGGTPEKKNGSKEEA